MNRYRKVVGLKNESWERNFMILCVVKLAKIGMDLFKFFK